MTLNSDAKFKKKLTFGFKYDMRNLMNFTPTTQKFENFVSFGSFCRKYIRFELKDTEEFAKFEKNPGLAVSKMVCETGRTFTRALKSLKNCTLMGFILSKAFNVSARKFHRNCVS